MKVIATLALVLVLVTTLGATSQGSSLHDDVANPTKMGSAADQGSTTRGPIMSDCLIRFAPAEATQLPELRANRSTAIRLLEPCN